MFWCPLALRPAPRARSSRAPSNTDPVVEGTGKHKRQTEKDERDVSRARHRSTDVGPAQQPYTARRGVEIIALVRGAGGALRARGSSAHAVLDSLQAGDERHRVGRLLREKVERSGVGCRGDSAWLCAP